MLSRLAVEGFKFDTLQTPIISIPSLSPQNIFLREESGQSLSTVNLLALLARAEFIIGDAICILARYMSEA